MADQTPFESYTLTLKNVVASIVSSMFITDYGVVTKVYDDKKHIDVKHAVIGTLKTGEMLDAYESFNVEILTISNGNFALNAPPAVGDPVLLIGLKDYVESTASITPTAPTTYTHYNQATLKAVHLAAFNASAKTTLECDNGTAKLDSDNIELNGNSKRFVTWDELNSALQSHTHAAGTLVAPPGTAGGPVTGATGAPVGLDISSAKTTTIKTGG